MTLRAYGAEPHIENFKQPIFNFCRRIGKKFLSNIGVSSKQNSFLKDFSLISFFYTLIILKIFYLRNPIGKFQTTDFKFLPQKIFPKAENFSINKIFSSEPLTENSKHPIFKICRIKNYKQFYCLSIAASRKCKIFVTIMLQKCNKRIRYLLNFIMQGRISSKIYKFCVYWKKFP